MMFRTEEKGQQDKVGELCLRECDLHLKVTLMYRIKYLQTDLVHTLVAGKVFFTIYQRWHKKTVYNHFLCFNGTQRGVIVVYDVNART